MKTILLALIISSSAMAQQLPDCRPIDSLGARYEPVTCSDDILFCDCAFRYIMEEYFKAKKQVSSLENRSRRDRARLRKLLRKGGK